jgi:hypothetical protein
MTWLPDGRVSPASISRSPFGWRLGATLFATSILTGATRSLAGDVVPAPEVLRASFVCEPLAAPGRLRCDVEARGNKGSLQWADVEVVQVAPFIVPLRGRVGPRDAATREDTLWRWSLGLLARARATGDVTVRVRAVVCEEAICTPELTFATAHVTVGRPVTP